MRTLLAALVVMMTLVFATPASALATATSVAPERTLAGVVPSVERFDDESGALDLEGVRATGAFRPATDLAVGYGRAHYWTRFAIVGGARASEPVLELFRNLDHVEVHEVRADGVVTHVGGNALPFHARKLPYPSLYFPLHVEPHEHVVIYVRAWGADAMDLTPKLWSTWALSRHVTIESTASGLYYGAILAIALYNLFLFVSTRARVFGYYVGAQLSYLALQAALERTTFRYLWPSSPGWAARSEIVFGALALAFGAAFGRTFLELDARSPRLARVLHGLTAIAVAVAVAGLFTSHTRLQQGTLVLVAFAMPVMIAVAAIAWARGNPNAPYFVLGYLLLTIASAIDVAQVFVTADIPTLHLRVGALAEALLLAFGLANGVKRANAEKAAALTALSESRREHAETLEARVQERTRALSLALDDLERTQKELARKERLAALGRLVSGVAHEVANPLNFASGGAARARTELDELAAALHDDGRTVDRASLVRAADTASRALRLVESGNERIRALVDNLRAYVRRERPPLVEVDLEKELRDTLSLCEAPLARVEVVREGPSMPVVRASPGELGQVFTNLVLNAAQAMPDGGRLVLESEVDDDELRVSFTDDGPGVPEALRERIFEPFFTTRAPGEGTGLGLSVSHEIVRASGGELRLEQAERGARFVVILPRA